MTVPENFQKVAIRHDCWVVLYFYRFAVATQATVSRIYSVAAGIADTRTDNTINTPEPGVWTPESAQGKCRRLGKGRFHRIYQRYSYISAHNNLFLLTAICQNSGWDGYQQDKNNQYH